MDANKFKKLFDKTADNVNTVIHGKDDVVRLALVAMIANGHILFDDVPGVGKSVLARALGQSMKANTARVQCTPDMLPGDITGSAVIDTSKGAMKFVFKEGPVFTNVLLVDEINRATPKTQSALLEAMAERNVSVDGISHHLPQPFLVLATQNPIELAGTFPLPEAQLDRFLFKLRMGYPDAAAERQVMDGNLKSLEVEGLEPVTTTQEVNQMQDLATEVELSDPVKTYIIEIVAATREEQSLTLGASPRASIALAKASRVMAASDARDHVYPEDVKVLLRPVMGHRMMLTPDAVLRGDSIDDVIDRIVARTRPPVSPGASKATSSKATASLTDSSEEIDEPGLEEVSADGENKSRWRRAKAGSK